MGFYCILLTYNCVVKVLNILHSDRHTVVWLQPVVFHDKNNMASLSLEKGLQKHFAGMMEDPQLIAAASFYQSVRPLILSLGLTDVIEASNSSSLQYWSAYFLTLKLSL